MQNTPVTGSLLSIEKTAILQGLVHFTVVFLLPSQDKRAKRGRNLVDKDFRFKGVNL
jgi:hypothetical protein